MPEERAEILCSDETDETNARQFIREFKEDFYPAYRDEGMTLFEAAMLWQLNRVNNALTRVEDLLEDKYA